MTGPELLSTPDLAVRLGEVLGRSIATVDVPLDAYREGMLAGGVDPLVVEVAVNGAKLVVGGGNARLTDDVAQALGRPPRTFATWAYDHHAAFGG